MYAENDFNVAGGYSAEQKWNMNYGKIRRTS